GHPGCSLSGAAPAGGVHTSRTVAEESRDCCRSALCLPAAAHSSIREKPTLERCPPHPQHLQSSRENCRPSKQVDRSSLSLGNTPFCLTLSRCCSPSHYVAARSPSAASGRSNHL